MTITANPEIVRILEGLVELLVPKDWNPRRQLAARASLEALAIRACQIGTAGAHVSGDRAAAAQAFEMASCMVAMIDATIAIRDTPEASAEAMQGAILSILEALADGRRDAA